MTNLTFDYYVILAKLVTCFDLLEPPRVECGSHYGS